MEALKAEDVKLDKIPFRNFQPLFAFHYAYVLLSRVIQLKDSYKNLRDKIQSTSSTSISGIPPQRPTPHKGSNDLNCLERHAKDFVRQFFLSSVSTFCGFVDVGKLWLKPVYNFRMVER
jgi:hypothetical protein